jgi:hypothetical protein
MKMELYLATPNLLSLKEVLGLENVRIGIVNLAIMALDTARREEVPHWRAPKIEAVVQRTRE